MPFSADFLAARLAHLQNMIKDTEKAWPSMSEEHKTYKTEFFLPLVHAAIKRVQRGNYGYCLSCGEEISAERLTSLPQAPLCRACQEEKEKIEKGGWHEISFRVGGGD